MGMEANIVGGVSNAKAEVVSQNNADAAKALAVSLSQTQSDAGFTALAVEQAGSDEPATRKVRRLKASIPRRLSVGVDTVLMAENFNATAQNTGLWKSGVTSFVRAQSAGFVVFNSTSITTSGASAYEQTYQHFNFGAQKVMTVDVPFIITAAPPANWQVDFGHFQQPGTTPYAPTDGVYFRLNSTGLYVVLNYAGTETVSTLMLAAGSITPNACYTARLVIGAERTEAWINDPAGGLGTPDAASFAYLGAIDTPSGNPYPCSGMAVPFAARLTHPAVAGAAVQFKLGGPTVTEGDVGQNRDQAEVMVRALGGQQGQNGQTMGSTALYTNSLAAGAGAAMTNTTAALGTGLGGQFSALPTLAVPTDGIVCSYQNPLPTTAIQGRTLVINGVSIQGLVTTAFTGGPVLYEYSLAYGHTAVSMATAEAVAAKAPRRVPLGFETYVVTAAVGVVGQGVSRSFKKGLPVNPGEFVAVCAKNLGTVTTLGAITFCVTYDYHWE